VVTEHHSPRADEVDLSGDELRQASLDGLAVDVPAPRRRQDRDVRPQVAKNSGPVPGGVLIEDAAVRRLEEIDERAAGREIGQRDSSGLHLPDERRVRGIDLPQARLVGVDAGVADPHRVRRTLERSRLCR
jgi:hypothetical protein